ncbi:unnamed protein product [Microthlaspi erraticum]|uniref:F-box domain-containing protein n=1 Tax=Microthlaspi erraticum TaxID=1685480 RepID=A0A6D2HDT5_9BRAS|nr:unnamed protein product [Microthlaspi erraticum]
MRVVPNLPDELLDEILGRIPATSLKRLRSTCTRWDGLFNDKKFTRRHFDKAAKQFQVIIMSKTTPLRICSMSVKLNGNPSLSKCGAIDPRSCLDQFEISKVFHCDGLLLCTSKVNTSIVVWNPCTGQTKSIEPSSDRDSIGEIAYTLGSYQDDNSSGNNSYKILSYNILGETDFEICEINSRSWKSKKKKSSSWRTLDVTPDGSLMYCGVSLKGKTYWLGWDEKENQFHMFLVSFDYTRESFGRTCLPYEHTGYETTYLSVFREEKLSVLLQRKDLSEKEIWVRNESDVWSKIVTVCPELDRWGWLTVCFLVDYETKVFVFSKKHKFTITVCETNTEEDIEVTRAADSKIDPFGSFGHDLFNYVRDIKASQPDSKVATLGSFGPYIISYVPSLVQIQ